MARPDVKKRIKLGDPLNVENLDPTAPVKKILDDMQTKNLKAFTFYSKLLGRRDKNVFGNHWDMVGHTISHFPDEYDGTLPPGYFEEFPYRSGLPVIITPIRNIGVPDPLTEILKIKKQWYESLEAAFKRADTMLNKYEKLNEEVVKCPQRMIHTAMCLESEPEPDFKGDYNWYYAGHGNLQMLILNGVEYLLHSELTCCYLSQFSKQDMKMNHETSITYDCGEGNFILETIGSDSNIVTLRIRKKIIILKIEITAEGLQFCKIKEIETALSYTGIAYDGYHKNILYVTSLDDTLKIVNLDRMTGKTVALSKSGSLLNNWNTVQYMDRTQYVHIAKNTITVYDKRDHSKVMICKDLDKFTTINCPYYNTSALVCEETPYIYLGSAHHLFCLDIRCCGIKTKILHRWTHDMQSPPTYLSRCNFKYDRELICLSSQWCDNMSLVVNDSKTEKYIPPSVATLPYRPPSIRNTLREARFRMLCSDIYNPIESRLHMSITGAIVTEKHDKYIVLMQNSLGDITCNTLYPKHLQHIIENDSPEKLHEWCQNYKLQKKDFVVSSTVNIAELWRHLKKVPDDYEFFKDDDEDKFSEKEIFDTFDSSNVDTGLLEAWEIRSEEKGDDAQSISHSEK